MIVERSMNTDWLSNTYLVAREAGGPAFFVDAGGPVEPLIAFAQANSLRPTHVLLTHRHHDHVAELGALMEAFPQMEVLAHPDEHVEGVTGDLAPDQELDVAGLEVRCLHTPGHTSGMISLLVTEAGDRDGGGSPLTAEVFTGDTLFKNSVGGVRAPGHTTYEDIKRSIMDVLLALPPTTTIRPGHTEPTTVAEELETNSFVRIWRGEDPEGDEQVTVWDKPAKLILWGDDYDGGHKAWIRWDADGADDIVGGSQVVRG